MIKTHTTRPLNNRLEYQRAKRIVMLLEKISQRPHVISVPIAMKRAPWFWREMICRQYPGKDMMHSGNRITDRHRMKRVAVISRANRSECTFFGSTFGMKILKCHFHRHLNGHRTGITEKNSIQTLWSQLHKFSSELNSRLVSETTEHHMTQGLRLFLYCCNQFRMAVTVNHRPPGRHSINQLWSVS